MMNRNMALFFLIMFAIGTDSFIVSPLMPTLRESFGITVAQSGWFVSAYALGYAAFALIAGPLSDGWNRKRVLVYGLFAFGLFTLLCGFAAGFWQMVAFRFLAGVSAAFASPQIWAAISQLVKPQNVLKAMGIATAGLAASQMLGVPLGSYLAASGWHTPFFAIGAAAFVLAILAAILLPAMPASGSKNASIWGRYRSLMSGSAPKLSFIAYFLFQFGNFGAFSFMGTWLSDRFHLSVAGVGTVMLFLGLGNMIGSFWGSGFTARFGQRHAFAYGVIFISLLYLLLPFMPKLALVEAAYFLIFLALGMLFPLMMNALQRLSPTARGTISSLANSSMYFGTTLGSLTAGFLYSCSGAFMSVSLLAAVCFCLSLGLFSGSGAFSAVSPVLTHKKQTLKQ